MSEYHWRFDDTMDCPISRALCLRAAIAERKGSKLPGLTFLERELVDRLDDGE